jgi:hypothetical protein
MWRHEIPKVFAKKYLEDPDMVSIHFELGRVGGDGHVCNMVMDTAFDRYEGGEGGTKNRCVFAEDPLTTGKRDRWLTEPGWRAFERKKNSALRKKVKRYLGSGTASVGPARVTRAAVAKEAARGRARFDLPPYQIRIKSMANDTELPGLKVNLQAARREISFEWQSMFDAFYSEAAMRLKKKHEAMAPLIRALQSDQDHSLVSIMKLVTRSRNTHRSSVKRIRRDRIKKQYLHKENHNLSFNDSQQFSKLAERSSLSRTTSFERHHKSARYAEDAEAKRIAKLYDKFGFRGRFDLDHEVMALIREDRGVREDDEGGLLALHDEMVKAEAEANKIDDDNDDDGDSTDGSWRRAPTGNLPRSMYSETTDDDED